ncbi:uncharacterized protein I303_100504 [Kwoniella dejecticola CBS 10117]|uniref:U3 small nucleolar ribonucleoprotein LCP5 n=1 Tax=Kwoniella dejecticola CBS 10117 TaxID=1296121 RepID=A0A1A6AF35_9TREE|nr:U3 small nucleolar ribonucleoprotein LCP5 [Kwoniella dejecticola CBS 10117]OBR88687.1 U3 small nucleolar ribonucleoprotein LCP5 [Kwoniella dejecticola CBS 10117]
MDSDPETTSKLSTEEVLRLFDTIQTSVEATSSSSSSLLNKVKSDDESLDFSNGLSLLLLRPQLLLSSLHNLIIMLSLRLLDPSLPFPTPEELQSTIALSTPLTAPRSHTSIKGSKGIVAELGGELILGQEVMDKIRGMESKLEYQIKKLVGLAEADEKKGSKENDDEVEEDPLSFRPNPSAIVSSREPTAKSSRLEALENQSDSDGEASSSKIYRPPRVAAVPYLDPSSSREEKKQRERQAPALLSEFAQSIDTAPIMESTSGLSVRQTLGGSRHHTNSTSQKRAEELRRINEFEESNMTRLVTSKKEAKRRRDDEAALAMGFGINTGRNRKGRNGLEAEMEGVLNERGSKGVWDNVGKLGERGDALQRGKKRMKR